MTARRNNRGRGRRNRRARVSAEMRHKTAVTLTKYVPPLHPRPREAAFKVRRVIQKSIKLTQSSSNPAIGEIAIAPKDWFTAEFSTTGFEYLFLHRVAIWSEIVVPGTGQTVFPNILVYHNFPAGVSLYPNFRGTCGAYNERARVGYYVPNHLAGPYSSTETKTMIDGRVFNSDNLGTFPVQSIQVEVDVTFC